MQLPICPRIALLKTSFVHVPSFKKNVFITISQFRPQSVYQREKGRFSSTMASKIDPEKVSINTPRDPNTLSNYHNFRTKHTGVDFTIDFEHKRLFGKVALDFDVVTEGETRELVLDSRCVKYS